MCCDVMLIREGEVLKGSAELELHLQGSIDVHIGLFREGNKGG